MFVEKEDNQARERYIGQVIWYYYGVSCFMKVNILHNKNLSLLNVKFNFILTALLEIFLMCLLFKYSAFEHDSAFNVLGYVVNIF